VAGIYSIQENKIQQAFNVGAAITDAVWYNGQPVISTSSGAVKVLGEQEVTFTSHAGSAHGLALHPCGDILASVGVDKSFVFYDLTGNKPVTQVYTDAGMFPLNIHKFYTNVKQSLLLLLSIPMVLSSRLEVLMDKSNFST
jgi:pre-mRNA-processing factor 19